MLEGEWEPQVYLNQFLKNKSSELENSLGEYELIQEYFSDIGSSYLKKNGISLSVGDDATLINTPENKDSVQSVDTALEGVHFFNWMEPKDIAYRSVAIALSDLAACGASPSWFMLSITLKDKSKDWLTSFRQGLIDVSDEFKIPLIGGDTTRGGLSITVHVGGIVDRGKFISRKGAKEGDLIFLSGSIGSATNDLTSLRKEKKGFKRNNSRYLRPKARISIGKEIIGIANSAIDISDGLIQDLQHICKESNLGANVYLKDIPFYDLKRAKIEYINSGDDYEICFTADPLQKKRINKISKDLNIPITVIGETVKGREVRVISEDGLELEIESGYKHF